MDSYETELPDWQKKLLDERLNDLIQNPQNSRTDFDEMLEEIRSGISRNFAN